MEILTLYEQINQFLENKRPRKHSACVRRQGPTYAGQMHAYASTDLRTQLRFQKPMKDKLSTLNTEVWNEFYIIWEPFQTPIFQLYKALYDIF